MEIINIIIESILISLICIGIKILYAPGKLLAFIGKALSNLYDKNAFGRWVSMPLGNCHYCMASIYGILIHFGLVLKGLAVSIDLLAAVLLISCYLNGLFYGVLKKLDKGL